MTGTVLGAVVVTSLLALVRPGPAALVVLVVLAAVLTFASYTLFNASYASFAVAFTALIVVMVSFTGMPTASAAADRALDTALRGLLALVLWAGTGWLRAPSRELS
jgi:uncharacterized membrane protein YccC